MDENSCEGETSKSIGNVVDEQEAKKVDKAPELDNVRVRFALGGKESRRQVSNRCVSSFDVSGPSTDISDIKSEDNTIKLKLVDEAVQSIAPTEENEQVRSEASSSTGENDLGAAPCEKPKDEMRTAEQNEAQVEQVPVSNFLLNYDEHREYQPRVRLAPGVEEQLEARRPSVGPPPSYSFVMKQKKKLKSVPSLDPLVTNRPPPPTYGNTGELYASMEESRLERICNLPSFAEPIWRSHSQPALCPRCGIIVLTTTHSHDSVATHVAALALCLFGCWPCCLLPYCMNVCKNTYHHCPICQTFLGLYTPW